MTCPKWSSRTFRRRGAEPPRPVLHPGDLVARRRPDARAQARRHLRGLRPPRRREPVGLGEQGLYYDGTRYLSRLELRVGGRRPLLLSSTVKKENDLLTVDLTNPDLTAAGGSCWPAARCTSFAHLPLEWSLLRAAAAHELRPRPVRRRSGWLDADFADIFEVRGTSARRGRSSRTACEGDDWFGYRGLDGVTRRTRVPSPPHALGGEGPLRGLARGRRQSIDDVCHHLRADEARPGTPRTRTRSRR